MTHLTSALFFTLVLLTALVAVHMTVQLSWQEIVQALRGELGRDVRRSTRRPALPRRRVAF